MAVSTLAMLLVASLVQGFFSMHDCCGSPLGSTCNDGTEGTPCCGHGACDWSCCNCKGGCREAESSTAESSTAESSTAESSTAESSTADYSTDQGPIPEIEPKFHSILFRQWPMLMSHDAGTGYAKDGTCNGFSTPINNWAVTQPSGGFLKQLGCGARAFDLRPYLKKDGTVVMHHGMIPFFTDIRVAVGDIIKWSERHKNTIVFISVDSCASEDKSEGKKCVIEADKMIDSTGAVYLDCHDVAKMTVGQILAHGKQKNGGSVVYTWANCVESNYDATIKCYGSEERRLGKIDLVDPSNITSTAMAPERELEVETGTCYGTVADRKRFFDPFWKYFDYTTNTATPPTDRMYVTQAHWQYDEESVLAGTARLSCIINGERSSKMNEKVAGEIRTGNHKNLFLLQVDNVCNHGIELAIILQHLANTRLLHPMGKFDKSWFPLFAPPHTASIQAASAFLIGGASLFIAAVLLRRGYTGRHSSAVVDCASMPIHGIE